MWPKLLERKCPIDSGDLKAAILDGRIYCSNESCDFDISEEKFDKIVDSLTVSPKTVKPPAPMVGRTLAYSSSI